MKLSTYLQNLMINFPIGHAISSRACNELANVRRAECAHDSLQLYAIAESWDLDPVFVDLCVKGD